MSDLKSLSDKVAASIANQDGSWQTRKEMLDAIEELHVTAMGPSEYITRLRYQALQNMSVMIALEMGLLKPIVERKGQPITAEDLAKATGSDKLLTVRIMRMLTVRHIAIEAAPETYTSNPNAEYLAHPSRVGAMKFLNGPTLKVMANVVPYMRANGGQFPQFPDASKNQVSVANFTHGMNLWELFRSEPEVLADFSAYLSGRREDMVGYWFDIWPAKERIAAILAESPQATDDDRALIVDVGGNVGYDLKAFQQRFPEFKGKGRLVLQDLPENIKNAKTLLEGTGIEAMEYDFFTPQPVKGARIYYFGGIYHDWPDADALRILSNVAAAMAPDSRIIIDEMPLPDEKAPLNLVTYDVLMMINVCGIERSIGHFRQLFDKVGLTLVDLWRSSLDTVLEVKLKQ